MAKRKTKILILENEPALRDSLRELCLSIGKTWVAEDMDSAMDLLTRHSFDMLILDWSLVQAHSSTLWLILDNFQPDSRRIALFKSSQLNDVITAMKSGMNDIFWVSQELSILKEKIKDCMEKEKPVSIVHSYVSQLAESLADRAMTEKISLFKAREEFAKVFLGRILKHQKLKRRQLAALMNITSRTLYRHMSK